MKKSVTVTVMFRCGYHLCGGSSVKRKTALVIRVVAGSAIMLSCNNASAKTKQSGVYCRSDRSGIKIYAQRVLPDGRLAFGLSIWSKAKNNIGVFGTAYRKGEYWEYAKDMDAQTASERCRIMIRTRSDRNIYITSDPLANCESMGGYDTKIGSVTFSRGTYEGQVTYELNDAEVFFGKAGRCWRK
jgi:hypothetical protein